ncbi:MAG TPA: bifunctional diguanylate cyclase/phosphodiesterase [Treponemataceae bacterium]|nr:bifunctional diguanylate cyclase/phosphodiesterase [Treponemataceae bacterium]
MISEQLYRPMLENLPQALLVATYLYSPDSKENDLLIDYVNPAWEKISGALANTIVGKSFSETVYASTNSSIEWLSLALEAIRTRKLIHKTVFSEIFEKWLDLNIIALSDTQVYITFSDVSEIKETEQRLIKQNFRLSSLTSELAESKKNLKIKLMKIETLNSNLEQVAFFDRLTGLPNRHRFTEIVTEQLEFAQRHDRKFAIAIMDVDNLKTLNDSLGHETGDELLNKIALKLRYLEKEDIQACRFGGDEFLLIIKNYEHEAELLHLVNKVQMNLSDTYILEKVQLKSSVSTGVATYPEDAQSLQDLLKYADIAMTDAKKRGKNTVSLFHAVMQETLLRRITMERNMIEAMEKNMFQLYYQPQFDSESLTLRGFEALIRWFDPIIGYISPNQFIPIAEETKFIITLGEWIIRTACTTLKDWQERLNFTGILSINISPIQLQHPNFFEDLQSIIHEYNIPRGSLEIEITEGIILSNYESSIPILNKLREIGVGISLDDFGTGYSSLSYLQYIPLTCLKIDKSFIDNIALPNGIEYDITNAIVTLVNKLGLDTIAEGVETQEQLSIIKKIGCRTIQGYLTGRPATASDCETLIVK